MRGKKINITSISIFSTIVQQDQGILLHKTQMTVFYTNVFFRLLHQHFEEIIHENLDKGKLYWSGFGIDLLLQAG